MPHWRLHYHLVWATKARESLIGVCEDETIRETFGSTAHRMGLMIHAVGTMPEHVHIAISIPPKYSVAEVVRAMKGSASRFINLKSQSEASLFRWQSEYGALSFSDRGMADVIDYVTNQKARHASNELYAALERIGEVEVGRSGMSGAKGPD